MTKSRHLDGERARQLAQRSVEARRARKLDLAQLRALTILDLMTDPLWFGKVFAGESWEAWKAFLAALFALPLSDTQLATYRTFTARQSPPKAPCGEAWLIVGRRGGKSRIAALVAVFLALRDYSGVLAPGEKGTVLVLAADRKQARTVFRYVLGLLDAVPALRALIVKRPLKESVELRNGVVIETHTASYRSVRGYTAVAVVADEVAFWQAEGTANPDREVLDALRPGMATVPGAVLLGISTPYARRGEVWRAHQRNYGREDAPVLVWQSDTKAMNPAVDQGVIDRAYEDDPIAAAAEYGGQFRSDVERFLTAEALDAVTVVGRLELAPVLPGFGYVAFTDPSGGSLDSMTLAVAHVERREGQTVAVLDCLRERRPPFSPDGVVREFAQVVKSYGVARVRGDRYAGEWPRERWAVHGVAYDVAPLTKSDIYKAVLPAINSGRVELLAHRVLRAQLEGLERRTARGGRDSVDHPPGGHDDVGNAACGALTMALDAGTVDWTGVGKSIAEMADSLRQANPWGDGQGGPRWHHSRG